MRNGTSSALSNFLVETIPCTGCPSLNCPLLFGMACTLCSVESLFLISSGCPTMIPLTCGWYWQPFWSSVTGVDGAGQLPAGGVLTETKTLARPPAGPTTTSSSLAGVGCCDWQYGSAPMGMFGMAGAAAASL